MENSAAAKSSVEKKRQSSHVFNTNPKDSCTGIDSRSLKVTKSSDDHCTRSQILKAIEPIVESFNKDDVFTITKSLNDLCARNVCIKIQLFPESNSDNVSANACSSQQFIGTGVSYMLLLWRFLRMTHPQGSMEIVDKRICYRQLLNQPKSSYYPHSEDRAFSSLTTNAPVSIVEAVVKFLGLCVATLPLHDLYCGLAQGLDTDLAPPVSTNTGNAVEPELVTDSYSDYISRYIKRTEEETLVNAGDPSALCSVSTGTITPTASRSPGGEQDVVSACQHGYILEHALVFDEQGQVTEWTFSVLAAESL